MSRVAPEYHVLVEAAKDAKINGGSVNVNHAILGELLAVWLAAQPKEPEAAAPVADQIAVGNAPAPPIDKPLAAAEAAAPASTEPSPDDAPPVTPEPTIQ
jgi:hypothetical protein